MARRPNPDGSQPPLIAHLAKLVTDSVPPLHPAGRPFVAAPLVLAAVGRKNPVVRGASLASAAAIAAFFRNPHRVPPSTAGAIVAPGDGEVCIVDECVPPAELGLGDVPLPRVTIFLSVLNVHVQRAPVAGVVSAVEYRPGKFLSADLPQASQENERCSMRIDHQSGQSVGVVQIAGLIARRILNEAHVGQHLELGDTYGVIRFGSRVDVYMPAGVSPQVHVGQRAIAGETVLGQLG